MSWLNIGVGVSVNVYVSLFGTEVVNVFTYHTVFLCLALLLRGLDKHTENAIVPRFFSR